MLNSGLGFSDEFEMEACSYSAKSSSKFMQQYREWTYTMRKESSAFFRSVKDKACYLAFQLNWTISYTIHLSPTSTICLYYKKK